MAAERRGSGPPAWVGRPPPRRLRARSFLVAAAPVGGRGAGGPRRAERRPGETGGPDGRGAVAAGRTGPGR
ncbi:MAG: hypothetical protein AVDCRST_MAG59-3701 [uncultured Thermomicrobiales bacterium]|uniref:Uncharacterized protein n=1 Tax=uncultured Thermomicrobiales bacterium TaxID=1645740 RepID=A0A6J4V9H2_9BACT|nr:MAG: hypothetical protein AVDCRST_MAG59-3701 [uncultured Thermomicrobiales bacterium]